MRGIAFKIACRIPADVPVPKPAPRATAPTSRFSDAQVIDAILRVHHGEAVADVAASLGATSEGVVRNLCLGINRLGCLRAVERLLGEMPRVGQYGPR